MAKPLIEIDIRMTPEELERRHAARNKKVLFRQGAYLKSTMQRSMRYSKKKSAPGEPPRAHRDTKRGPLLRKLIRFEVNEAEGSVTCGPPKVGSDPQPVPQVLDQGGRVPVARLLRAREFQVGEMGPIRYVGGGKLAGTRLLTPAQAERATRLQQEENAVRAARGSAAIAARPFTKPLLTDGGKNFRELIRKVPL